MPLTPAPTKPTRPFIICEVSGGGGDGKTHFALSCVGKKGNTAYFHSSQKPGTLQDFARWAANNGRELHWSDFGLYLDSRWDDNETKRRAEEKLSTLISDLSNIVKTRSHHTAIIDSMSFVKYLALIAKWGKDLPLTYPKDPTKKPYVDRMSVYGPVNDRIRDQIYQLFSSQPQDRPGVSLIMTSEGVCSYTDQSKATNVYTAPALGKIEYHVDMRVVVAGPMRGPKEGLESRANTIVYHRGDHVRSQPKLGKIQPRVEFPEALAFLLEVDPSDWGRGPDVPPTFALPSCPGPLCKNSGLLEWGKLDGQWKLVEPGGKPHVCPAPKKNLAAKKK